MLKSYAQSGRRSLSILVSISSMCCVGPVNFVLYKILFASYGDASAFFVMSFINLIFVVYGGIALTYVRYRGDISAEMESLPRYPYFVMAALDCVGGLLAAMGAAATPGQLQTLLNQSLVPCTMFASSVLLGRKYSLKQLVGAGVILTGAVVVVSSDYVSITKTEQASQFAALIYWSSNIPMSLSSVYKEYRFGAYQINTIYLTQQVSIYQFFFGFLFAPIETIPGIATRKGVPFSYLVTDFMQRSIDFLHGSRNALFLLSYVAANFTLNTTGLFVTKLGGAALTAVAYSILVPCSTLAFSAPCLASFREPLRLETIFGLLLVFFGFVLYEFDDIRITCLSQTRSQPEAMPLHSLLPASPKVIDSTIPTKIQATRDFDHTSFQERFIPLHMITPLITTSERQSRRRSRWFLHHTQDDGSETRRSRSVDINQRPSLLISNNCNDLDEEERTKSDE
mmetsp:Transcript_7454/g.11140  ORF Transcript_7454/g.11140 Transcript_7454/m.11140 type:complete len:454 (+) Transcript_7454:35-1396(+)